MTADNIKNAISKLESLCQSYGEPSTIKLEDLEETILSLNLEVQQLDLASHQGLKQDLGIVETALAKLSSVLRQQQENIEHHVKEICAQQRALSAYSRVANNNVNISSL